MGRLHARVYSQMPRVKVMGVYDASEDAAAAVADEFAVPLAKTLGQLLESVDAVTIAVPTKYHLEMAQQCIPRKIACLIEKPLAKDVAEAKKIVELAKQYGVTVQVGHIERFNPAIRAMSRLDIQPRFLEVTRISPMTFRSIDVGVVLDMMIHDIDIVLRLANSTVSKIDATGVSVLGEVEDICNARLTFANGCVANLTASRLAMKTARNLRVFSNDAYVSIDYQKRHGIVVRRSGNIEAIREAAAKIRSGEIEDLSQLNYADIVHIEELKIDDVEPLRAELDAFVDAIISGSRPVVSAEDGLHAVEVARRIVETIGPPVLT
ncbi:MAG: Gfo/Idh/MocA family oxidoreductase [Planctomycetota bacterium]|nr:Gfo/Idh/MocA family oxidoreductase [Planctomycetota bacterium]